MFGSVEYLRQNLWIGALFVIGINVLMGIVIFIRGKWNSEISETVARNLRDKIYSHFTFVLFSNNFRNISSPLSLGESFNSNCLSLS